MKECECERKRIRNKGEKGRESTSSFLNFFNKKGKIDMWLMRWWALIVK